MQIIGLHKNVYKLYSELCPKFGDGLIRRRFELA